MTKFEFTQGILGSNDGINIKEYKKGEVIDKTDLSEELFKSWAKNKVIIPVSSKEKEKEKQAQAQAEAQVQAEADKTDNTDDINETGLKTETEAQAQEGDVSNTGDKDVDNFLNGETDKTPEETTEITDIEARKLLIEEVKKIVETEPIDTDKLKDYGIQLGIKNMNKTVNPDTIIKKVKEYLAEIDNEQKDAE